MMSKKDFEVIAKILNKNCYCDIDGNVVYELCDYFKEANPRFDRKKFLKAVNEFWGCIYDLFGFVMNENIPSFFGVF